MVLKAVIRAKTMFVSSVIPFVLCRVLWSCDMYLFTYTGVKHDFHIIMLLVFLTVILMEQELLSCRVSMVCGVHVAQSYVFCEVSGRLLFVVLSFLLLTLLFSVFRFTASNNLFGFL
jgi:hypothetical protein